MKSIIITLSLFLAIALDLSAQNHYVLDGVTYINCNPGPHTYFIDSEQELQITEWLLITPSGSVENPCLGCADNVYFVDLYFFEFGVYTLVSTSITLDNETLSDTLNILVDDHSERPTVLGCFQFTGAGCYRVCAGSTVQVVQYQTQFVEFVVTGAEEYVYINQSTIEITWGEGGSGTVEVFADNCYSALCFEILPLPVADFITQPTPSGETLTVCRNQEIFFENTSFNGLNYLWTFGDGEISNSYDASHSYATPGFYTVTLLAESICECSDEKQFVIEVLPEPAPMLDCINSVCPETRQRYTATTDGCTQYNWTISANGTIVNGGEPTDDFIEVIWHEGPDGFIELSVSGCQSAYCSFTNTFRIPIISPDGPVTGDVAVCAGEVVSYTAPYFPGTTYQWQVGSLGTIIGGQNTNGVTIRWQDVNMASSSTVSVDYNNCFLECSGSASLAVAITPEIHLTGDVQVCQDANATVMAEAGFITPIPAPVLWHIENAMGQTVFSSATPSSAFSHVFSYPPGEYEWVATNDSPAYCTEVIRRRITVTATPPSPLGIKGETDICPGLQYGFTIESAGNYSTTWTITDGASTFNYTGQTCAHTFGNTQPYIVEAVHTDIQFPACVSAAFQLILQRVADQVITGEAEVCLNGINSYAVDRIDGADYQWEIIPDDHGEIRTTDLHTIDIFWTQTGPVTLRLNVCGTVIEKNIVVHGLPITNVLGPMSACANETVTLSSNQTSLTHTWINDSNILVGSDPTIDLYAGSYALQLTDVYGCSNKKTFDIISLPVPKVHVSCESDYFHCNTFPNGVELVANTDGVDYVYTWFRDNVSMGIGGPIYLVPDFGSYHVEVVNQYGCKAVSPDVAFINCCDPNICPDADGSLPGCSYPPYFFDILTTETACETHQYTPQESVIPGSTHWVIKSITKGVLASQYADVMNFTYDLPGYYQITMISQLDGFVYPPGICGHYQKFTDAIRAVADFESTGICVDAMIDFEDLTTFLPGESIASWHWNFDDPASGADNTSSAQHPTHMYAAPGTYDVTLTVTMASGCVTSKTIAVEIISGPALAPVYAATYCEGEAMAFDLPGELFEVEWDFGDPASGAENSAVKNEVFHTYTTPGMYTVTVGASNFSSCRTITTFQIEIKENTLNGMITVDPSAVLCIGDTATLSSPAGGITWLWNTGETTSEIKVTETNPYSVLIRDAFFCTYSPPSQFIEVLPEPSVLIQAREILGPDLFGPWLSSLRLCDGMEFELQAFSNGNVTYQWAHGPTSQFLQFTNEGANLPLPGQYQFSVIATDVVSGCASEPFIFDVEILGLPDVPVIALISGSGCGFDDNILEVTNPQPGIEYHWSDGQEGVSITTQISGLYDVTAIDVNGCSSQSNIINIKPSAAVDQLPGGCFVACDPLSVCLPPMALVGSYTIYQNGVIFETGTSWPGDFLITADGSYTIEITTLNGCVATSDPLDVTLYQGIGSITVLTYDDTDGSGTISSGDVLLPGIPVQIISDDGQHEGMTNTNAQGHFVFEDYPATNYTALFDLNLLPSQWKVLIDSVSSEITTCGDSVIVSLLLTDNCLVIGPDQNIESCPGDEVMVGDSIWTEPGTYTMHMNSASGCDSVFQVVITQHDSIEINVVVWVDVDHDGIVSPADTVIEGITIVMDRQISMSPFTDITDLNGEVSGIYPSGNYIVSVDSLLLPPGIELVYGLDYFADTLCGTVYFNFLLTSSCTGVFVIQQEELCAGDSLFVEGQWITEAGQYTFVYSDPVTLCDTIIDLYVTVTEEIIVQSVIDWTCESLGSILLDISGEGPFSIFWGQGIMGDTMLTGLQDGEYPVTITDANGCMWSDTFTITSSPGLSFDVPPYYLIQQGDSVLITITGDVLEPGLQFQWTPAAVLSCPTCSSSQAFPIQSTNIVIQITDEDSCVYTLETFVEVFMDTFLLDQVYAPNVFTPDGDGLNDHWTISSKLENTFVQQLGIYDRWGNMVYAQTDVPLNSFIGWDGTRNAKRLNPGVFVYVARLLLGDGQEVVLQGDITLVR